MRDDIIEGMARALWVSAYADYVDENPDEDLPRAGGGENWMDVAPSTPDGAERAALDLAALYEDKNDATMEELAERAMKADGKKKKFDPEAFGHYLAMMAIGTGVSWFDDHRKFQLEVPDFEAHYEDGDLWWSGGRINVNPKKPLRDAAGHITLDDHEKRARAEFFRWTTDDRRPRLSPAELARIKSRNPARLRNPPFVLPVPGQRIKSWEHGNGLVEKICEKGVDGSYTAYIKLDDGRRVSVPAVRTEYDLTPRKVLERRTGYSRHEQFIAPARPERLPRGTPVELDDTVVPCGNPERNPAAGYRLGDEYVLGTWAPGSRVQLAEWSWGQRGAPVAHKIRSRDQRPSEYLPGGWARVICNGAATTGVVIVKLESNGAIVEMDERAPLYEIDVHHSTRQHAQPGKLA